MGDFQSCQERFPVAAAALRSRGDGTPAARIGGLIASIAGALVVRAFLLPTVPWAAAAAIGAGRGILGPLGDLSESMLKRAFDKKDSSQILPGHGGLLDRIDALLFNAPFVWLCARILQPG